MHAVGDIEVELRRVGELSIQYERSSVDREDEARRGQYNSGPRCQGRFERYLLLISEDIGDSSFDIHFLFDIPFIHYPYRYGIFIIRFYQARILRDGDHLHRFGVRYEDVGESYRTDAHREHVAVLDVRAYYIVCQAAVAESAESYRISYLIFLLYRLAGGDGDVPFVRKQEISELGLRSVGRVASSLVQIIRGYDAIQEFRVDGDGGGRLVGI